MSCAISMGIRCPPFRNGQPPPPELRPAGYQSAFGRHEERLQKLSLSPREYIERQVRVTPYPTEDVGWITEQVGPDVCLFSTDFPHVEGGRRPMERFERSLGDADEDTRTRFYAANFVDLMGDGLPEALRVTV